MKESEVGQAESGRPAIDLTFDRALCDRHGELFHERWPAGYPAFLLAAFDLVLALPEVVAELEPAEPDGFAAAVERLLGLQPMCCRLPPAGLLAVLREAWQASGNKPWAVAVCRHCRERQLGGPYRMRNPKTGEVVRCRHVCLECAVLRVKPV